MPKKIIAVIGATGAQGGGLAKAILADANGEFSLRAVTRNPDGAAAKALAAAGAEVVVADLDDVESLKKAFKGAHGAYCVTNFWEHMQPAKEIAQAKNLADAAKAAGVAHVIWSTLEDSRLLVPLSDERMPTLQGKYKVPHFDTKGESDAFFDKDHTTFLLTAFYWDNLIHFGMGPKTNEKGELGFVLPMADKKLPGIAAEDIGKCAYGIFKRGASTLGKRIGISGEQLTGAQMAAAMSQVVGKPIAYQAVPPEVYRSFGFPGADDLGNMFQYKAEFETQFCGARSVSESKALNPELQSFTAWLTKNKAKIPLT
jgi:uncharacterized protein YbjT (DUF2867 family)